jgi:hypothetical protein
MSILRESRRSQRSHEQTSVRAWKWTDLLFSRTGSFLGFSRTTGPLTPIARRWPVLGASIAFVLSYIVLTMLGWMRSSLHEDLWFRVTLSLGLAIMAWRMGMDFRDESVHADRDGRP